MTHGPGGIHARAGLPFASVHPKWHKVCFAQPVMNYTCTGRQHCAHGTRSTRGERAHVGVRLA
eukprot:1338741-Alexandrium_andersonii.AAC.1